jgi:uncharacterized protein
MSNVKMIRELYAAFGRGEIEAVLATFDARIEWRQAESHPYAPGCDPWSVPDAVAEKLFKRIAAEFDGFRIQTKEFHDAGDVVVVEGRYTGTYKPTGKLLDAQFCHVWKIRGGKIASFQQFVDTAKLKSVMGAR